MRPRAIAWLDIHWPKQGSNIVHLEKTPAAHERSRKYIENEAKTSHCVASILNYVLYYILLCFWTNALHNSGNTHIIATKIAIHFA